MGKITVFVQYKDKREKLGIGPRLKREFQSFQRVLNEIRDKLSQDIPPSFPLKLHYKIPNGIRMSIRDDFDICTAIQHLTKKELIIYAENSTAEIFPAQMQARVENLEGQVQFLTDELSRFKLYVHENFLHCPVRVFTLRKDLDTNVVRPWQQSLSAIRTPPASYELEDLDVGAGKTPLSTLSGGADGNGNQGVENPIGQN